MSRREYQSDISNEVWEILEPLIPPEKPGGRPRTTSMREVTNAIWYVLYSGCQWSVNGRLFLPHCLMRKSYPGRCYQFMHHQLYWYHFCHQHSNLLPISIV